MKSFVEQSERHYVSVPRHHLWSRIYIILRVPVCRICPCMWMYVLGCRCPLRVCTCVWNVMQLQVVYANALCMYVSVLRYSCVSSLSFSFFRHVRSGSFFRSFSPAFCSLSSTLPHFLSHSHILRSLRRPSYVKRLHPCEDLFRSWLSKSRQVAGATCREISKSPPRVREAAKSNDSRFDSNRVSLGIDASPFSITLTSFYPAFSRNTLSSLDSLVVNRLRKYLT